MICWISDLFLLGFYCFKWCCVSSSYIKSAEYISKEEATNRMKEDLGEDFLQWLGDVENPLLPSIDVRFIADYANSDSMAMVEKWIGKKTIVKEVIYQKTLTNTINDNINKIKIILFAINSSFMNPFIKFISGITINSI